MFFVIITQLSHGGANLLSHEVHVSVSENSTQVLNWITRGIVTQTQYSSSMGE